MGNSTEHIHLITVSGNERLSHMLTVFLSTVEHAFAIKLRENIQTKISLELGDLLTKNIIPLVTNDSNTIDVLPINATDPNDARNEYLCGYVVRFNQILYLRIVDVGEFNQRVPIYHHKFSLHDLSIPLVSCGL